MNLKSCLLIHNDYSANAATIQKHYESFSDFGNAFYFLITPHELENFSECFVNKFDAVIIHYSVYLKTWQALYSKSYDYISNFSGYTICFIQDEYRHIDLTVDILLELDVDVLYSVCPAVSQKIMYRRFLDAGKSVKLTLTGYSDLSSEYNTQIELDIDKWSSRPIDISYRARDLGREWRWLGKRALEKANIAQSNELFVQNGVKTDISTKEEERLYGEGWIKLLKSSKCCLIAISGASVCDFTGEIQESWLNNTSNLRQLKDFEKFEYIFSKVDGKIDATAISPRVFEAALHGVLMIGYEDHYNDIIKPHEHYIVLKRDHSNIEEVIQKIKNKEACKKIIRKCYKDLIISNKYTFKTFVINFEKENGFAEVKIKDIYPIISELRSYNKFLTAQLDALSNRVELNGFNVKNLKLLRHKAHLLRHRLHLLRHKAHLLRHRLHLLRHKAFSRCKDFIK